MRRRLVACSAFAALVVALALATVDNGSPAAAPTTPQIKHLFVIVLENENASNTFSANPPAPYLGRTMPAEGAYLPNYYGIGHQSLDNYIAMVSGQPPNPVTQSDCQTFTDFAALATREDGVALGQGCVYPRSVQTVANQLEASGHSWRGYMQDMGNSVAAGEPATCRHPAIGAKDETQIAEAGDQYAARHDPFVYFHSIIDYETCNRNVVDLNRLPGDLAGAATTPEYSFITPDLCADGHDEFCADGSPGSFVGINEFLSQWVPRIEASPAFADHGALLVTFDESESGAESCCGEKSGPNTPNNGGTVPGAGGGQIGAVLVSPCIAPGTVSQTPYNHYSTLRWVEDNFGLAHLAEAGAAGLAPFGTDVFDNPSCNTRFAAQEAAAGGGGPGAGATTRLVAKPRHAVAGRKRIFRFRLVSDLAGCRAGATIHFAGRRLQTNGRGRARVKLRPARAGVMRAVARPPGCAVARAQVRVRPSRADRS